MERFQFPADLMMFVDSSTMPKRDREFILSNLKKATDYMEALERARTSYEYEVERTKKVISNLVSTASFWKERHDAVQETLESEVADKGNLLAELSKAKYVLVKQDLQDVQLMSTTRLCSGTMAIRSLEARLEQTEKEKQRLLTQVEGMGEALAAEKLARGHADDGEDLPLQLEKAKEHIEWVDGIVRDLQRRVKHYRQSNVALRKKARKRGLEIAAKDDALHRSNVEIRLLLRELAKYETVDIFAPGKAAELTKLRLFERLSAQKNKIKDLTERVEAQKSVMQGHLNNVWKLQRAYGELKGELSIVVEERDKLLNRNQVGLEHEIVLLRKLDDERVAEYQALEDKLNVTTAELQHQQKLVKASTALESHFTRENFALRRKARRRGKELYRKDRALARRNATVKAEEAMMVGLHARAVAAETLAQRRME